jgi:hypothetical protein
MSKDYERLPLQSKMFLGCLRIFSHLEHERNMPRSLRQAIQLEERAATSEGQFEEGRLLLSAGRAYLNARKHTRAVMVLETARPVFERQKLQGTFHGFMGLADLYQSLGAAYSGSGRQEAHDAVRTAAESLALEIEGAFEIRTTFLPDGGRLISRAPNALEEPAA